MVSLCLLIRALESGTLQSKSFVHLRSLGFGSVSYETLILQFARQSSGIVAITLVANLPQLILTFLYFTFNGILTCMLLAKECNGYAVKRSFLRVSSPKGSQRGTYWLQVPFRYSIPLLVLSTVLHWFVSQSIFIVRVLGFDNMGKESPSSTISTCGYSPIAIISTLILGGAIFSLGIAFGFRKYTQGAPLIGSSSAAISAACHPPKLDIDAPSRSLVFGEVLLNEKNAKDRQTGHCCFTSYHVSRPSKGKMYTGLMSMHESRIPKPNT